MEAMRLQIDIWKDQMTRKKRDGPREEGKKEGKLNKLIKEADKRKKMTALTSAEALKQHWKPEGEATTLRRQFTTCLLHS